MSKVILEQTKKKKEKKNNKRKKEGETNGLSYYGILVGDIGMRQ